MLSIILIWFKFVAQWFMNIGKKILSDSQHLKIDIIQYKLGVYKSQIISTWANWDHSWNKPCEYGNFESPFCLVVQQLKI
jgi:hypothetical protein